MSGRPRYDVGKLESRENEKCVACFFLRGVLIFKKQRGKTSPPLITIVRGCIVRFLTVPSSVKCSPNYCGSGMCLKWDSSAINSVKHTFPAALKRTVLSYLQNRH